MNSWSAAAGNNRSLSHSTIPPTLLKGFALLDALLHQLPHCLRPGGRIAFLTFHSGEDRRVKHFFREGLRGGTFSAVSEEVIRPSAAELRDNPRSSPAKLRWAVKTAPPLS